MKIKILTEHEKRKIIDKEFVLDVDGFEVEVNKHWYIDDVSNEYETDFKITRGLSALLKLEDFDIDELEDYIHDLE